MLRRLGKHLKYLFVPAPRGDTVTPGYHAYVTHHDRTVPSAKLSDAIGRLSDKHKSALEAAWAEMESGLAGWRTKHLILAADVATKIRDSVPAPDLANTVISILVDQSGSMRGQKMLYAAASTDIAQEFLRTLGIKVEVLGFTTRNWRGGGSRRIWDADGRPRNPGRLNELLHIIYRQADDSRQSSLGACPEADVAAGPAQGEHRWRSNRMGRRTTARATRGSQDSACCLRRSTR